MAESMLQNKNSAKNSPQIMQAKETGASQKPDADAIQPEGSSGRKETGKKSEKQPVKSSAKSKAPITCEKDLNKEVLKILQEMNSNINKQGQDLKILSERVDTLYQGNDSNQDSFDSNQGCYDDSYDYDDEGDENYPPNYSDNDHSVGNDDVQIDPHPVEPPFKKPKTLFQGLSDKFLLADKVDTNVNEDLADFVNRSFRNGVPEETIQEILKEVHRPQNCEALTKTRVNPGMWRLLKAHTQTEDAKMQLIQNCVVKASINIVKLLHKQGDTDSQAFELGSNALALLGHSNKLINNRRKESHKNDF
ncbi:uncharacterized protein LOC123560776 [Mercenaria mercenaria]|uniref:uncharacterized protein LOC123560776 n=1 Tax=Mercenaria mercenaria TaxID=6596 RepID=UPI00234E4A9E|nr:uncharacterized protein LOC123560776 [Mercenaria mercenaria]